MIGLGGVVAILVLASASSAKQEPHQSQRRQELNKESFDAVDNLTAADIDIALLTDKS